MKALVLKDSPIALCVGDDAFIKSLSKTLTVYDIVNVERNQLQSLKIIDSARKYHNLIAVVFRSKSIMYFIQPSRIDATNLTTIVDTISIDFDEQGLAEYSNIVQ